MTVYQVVRLFLNGASHTSLQMWCRQFPDVSYHSLTAFFHQQIAPQILLALVCHRFHPLTPGWLILDEIILARSKVGRCRANKKRWKTSAGHVTPGFSVVVLLWTDGYWRIPLGFRLWRPGDGSHVDAALDLLSWVRNKLHWKPACVLFDAGFAAERLLARLDNYGWAFVCRVPRSRRFEGVQLKRYKRQGNWHAAGEAWCGLKLLAIRRNAKFYVTNRLSWDVETVLAWYSKRSVIEEVFKILCGVCHWKSCHSSNDAAIERFLAIGAITFMVWEAERVHDPGHPTIYRLRRKAILSPRIVNPSSLQRLPRAC